MLYKLDIVYYTQIHQIQYTHKQTNAHIHTVIKLLTFFYTNTFTSKHTNVQTPKIYLPWNRLLGVFHSIQKLYFLNNNPKCLDTNINVCMNTCISKYYSYISMCVTVSWYTPKCSYIYIHNTHISIYIINQNQTIYECICVTIQREHLYTHTHVNTHSTLSVESGRCSMIFPYMYLCTYGIGRNLQYKIMWP